MTSTLAKTYHQLLEVGPRFMQKYTFILLTELKWPTNLHKPEPVMDFYTSRFYPKVTMMLSQVCHKRIQSPNYYV